MDAIDVARIVWRANAIAESSDEWRPVNDDVNRITGLRLAEQ